MNNSIDRASTSATDKPEFSGEWVRLGDICNVRSGGTPKRSVSEYWDKGTIPWVKIGDISSKYISATEENISEAGLKNSAAKLFQPGTLLFSIFASIGAVGILTVPAATNQAIAGLEIKSNIINRDYLFYFLKASEMSAKHSGRGVAQNNINLSILRDMKVPVPSLAEQSAIAREFERIDCQIDNANNQLSSLDALVKSRFNEMFGDGKYTEYELGSRMKTTSGGTPSRKHQEYYEGGLIPWLTSGEINKGKIDAPEHFITEKGLSHSAAKLVPANSVVVAMYGATAGQVGIVGYSTATNQAVCCIAPTDACDPVFLRFALEDRKKWMVRQCLGGAQPNISQGIIRKVMIPDAPIETQKSFAQFVAHVDKLRFDVQQQIDKLELLKSSLMQEYFG